MHTTRVKRKNVFFLLPRALFRFVHGEAFLLPAISQKIGCRLVPPPPPGAARTPATSSVLRFVRCIGASSDRLVIYLLDTVSLNSSANLVLLALKFWENMTRLWNARTFDTMILFQVLLIELQSEQVFNGRSLTKIYQIEISSSRIIFFSIAF